MALELKRQMIVGRDRDLLLINLSRCVPSLPTPSEGAAAFCARCSDAQRGEKTLISSPFPTQIKITRCFVLVDFYLMFVNMF